ncbi:MAG: hypothetical protein R3F11_29850 [Verrucomicrobiales bacterium]
MKLPDGAAPGDGRPFRPPHGGVGIDVCRRTVPTWGWSGNRVPPAVPAHRADAADPGVGTTPCPPPWKGRRIAEVLRATGINGPAFFARHRIPGLGDANWAQILSELEEIGYRCGFPSTSKAGTIRFSKASANSTASASPSPT